MAYPVDVFVERIATMPEQIEEYGPVTQPVTITDSRAHKFVQRFGTETVELDAIPARQMRRIVREAIESHMEPAQLRTLQMVEREERETITVVC
jgi:hypothetical protein